jgi:hypothetical protein
LTGEHVFVYADEHVFGRVAILVVFGVFLWAVFARSSDAGRPAERYRVRAGDTLWAIAGARYAGDPRAGVWKIQQRNHLASASIAAGQVLVLP